MTNVIIKPFIEIDHPLTFPMLSREIQESDFELVVQCRVWWSPWEGMNAEPLTYSFGDRDGKISSARTRDGLDLFIEMSARNELSDDYLERLLRDHPAFELARRHEYDEIDTDRAEYMSAVY